MNRLSSYLRLCRIPLSLFAASSAAAGYFLDPLRGAGGGAVPAAAVFLLSCGASALNQYQEREIDGRMERTRHRPLPSGAMRPGAALVLSAFLIATGLGLSASRGAVPALLGAAAVAWYNGVYTPLKRKTAFAAVFGAPAGMLPPAIGWTAGGGSLADPRLFAIAMVLFLWQVPHFWLLLLGNGDDYERAGLPSLTKIFPKPQLARITMLWTASAAAAVLLLPLYGIIRSTPARAALLAAAVLLTVTAYRPGKRAFAPAIRFRIINAFIAAVMLLVAADALLLGAG